MFIARKNSILKGIITDIRFLNSRLKRVNLAFSLIKDDFVILGSSKCECLSVLDLKDAYHAIKLSESSKPYCSILPYFGLASYLHQGMPMGLKCKPIYMTVINKYYFRQYT